MPKLGQAMEFGTIAEWLAADGATVGAGEPVASVESDKATYEIEATEAGVIRHLAAVGDEIPVGEPFAMIGEPGAALTDPAAAAVAPPLSPRRLEPAALAAATGVGAAAAGNRALASPKARFLARSLNLDIRGVSPHRPDGLIVAVDVEAASAASAPAEGMPLTRLQKSAAERLSRSWSQAPHIVQMLEVDAGPVAEALAAAREGPARITLNDILIKAAADCLAQFPAINARFGGDRLIPRSDVSVGLAVATEGGLMVPVVRGADRLALAEVAERTRRLIAAARAGRLGADDIGRASLTISNLGAYGILFGTPVLNLDEAVLVFVGAVEERPVVQDGKIVVGRRAMLSIAYDHRIVDGLAAARFSQALKRRLEASGASQP
jgi:pyruvate/2-oxoglutarate dehydrogenase complex dihydrolipoamide acyltransferase (E2) component